MTVTDRNGSHEYTDAELLLYAGAHAVDAYFRAKGVDPTYLSSAFIFYWLQQGKTPDQIFRIAMRQEVES